MSDQLTNQEKKELLLFQLSETLAKADQQFFDLIKIEKAMQESEQANVAKRFKDQICNIRSYAQLRYDIELKSIKAA